MATNQTKFDGIFDSIFVGGGSMRGGKSLQGQLADAEAAAAKALAAPLIVGWPGPNNTTYSTSVLQQLVYITQAGEAIKSQNSAQSVEIAALKTELVAVKALLAGSGPIVVEADIDYDVLATKIAEKMPSYKLVPEEGS